MFATVGDLLRELPRKPPAFDSGPLQFDADGNESPESAEYRDALQQIINRCDGQITLSGPARGALINSARANVLRKLIRETARKLRRPTEDVAEFSVSRFAKTIGQRSSRAGRCTAAEANLRAREALKVKQQWSERTLAKAIGCSTGLVHRLPAWQAWREQNKPRRDSAPKAIPATSKVLGAVGNEDPELKRLIAEQTRNFEESPLVPTNPRKGRRLKL